MVSRTKQIKCFKKNCFSRSSRTCDIVLFLFPKQRYNTSAIHPSVLSFEKETQRLNRLHEDHRFVLAACISIIVYVTAWVPYSIVALAQVFGNQYNPWILTTCAILAKLVIITNPVIFGILLKGNTGVILLSNTK